jgi:hypothetical protein
MPYNMNGFGHTLARGLLALFLLGTFIPAQGNVSETVAKSAMKRAARGAEAKLVGKAIYRKLPARIEATFDKRLYSQRVLKQDLLVHRYHSPLNAHPDGYVFATTDKFASEKVLRDRLAIPPIDNVKGAHITEVTTYRIPHNTLISEGTVAPLQSYRGGGYQVVLVNPPEAWVVGKQSFKAWREGLGR